jgi:hypothetical protein
VKKSTKSKNDKTQSMIEITEEQSSSFQNFKLLLHKEYNQKESPEVEVNKQPLVDFSPI